jgi:phage/plasmid-like protein (TIGR03299 family)
MAHELENTDGTTFYADSRDDAWHQLGQKVGHNMTVEEAMAEAHLGGWNVRKVPLTIPPEVTDTGVFNGLEVTDQFGVVRTNPVNGDRDYLGVVGNVYDPIQNESTAGFIQSLVDEFGANLETAGSLGGGRDVFVTMKLPHTMEVVGVNGHVDKTEYYLAALNNHTGKTSFRVILTPIRVVCRNTQQAAIGAAKTSWKVRHTATAVGKVQEAREKLGLVWSSVGTLDAEFQRLAEIPLEYQEAKEFTERLVELKKVDPESAAATRRRNAAGKILDLYRNSPTITPIAGTKFAMYNAVTEYVDWFQGVRGAGEGTKAQQDARALRSIRELEQSSTLKTDAFSLLKAGV